MPSHKLAGIASYHVCFVELLVRILGSPCPSNIGQSNGISQQQKQRGIRKCPSHIIAKEKRVEHIIHVCLRKAPRDTVTSSLQVYRIILSTQTSALTRYPDTRDLPVKMPESRVPNSISSTRVLSIYINKS